MEPAPSPNTTDIAQTPSHGKKKILFFILFGPAVLIILLLTFFVIKKTQNVSNKQTSVASAPAPESTPSVSFASYSTQTTLPVVPSSIKQYALKTDFSLDEAKAFAKQFGLTKFKATDPDNPVFYSEDKNTRGVMVFNKETGTFSYQSWRILKPTTIGTTSTATALSFLKQIGAYDDTITCGITYKRTIAPKDLTFVECHRMPETLGAVLLNPVGILNLPEQTPLSSLRVGYAGASGPLDATIEQVSTGENGKARPDDFNTFTVGVFPDGRIFSVDSTMRWIQETKQIAKESLFTPQEAILQFKRQKAAFSLTIPAGQGTADWNTVYPQNKAEADIATITDYLLVYIEKPLTSTQTSYEPSYLIRGKARLKSGYMVEFVETISAVKNTNVFGVSTTKQLAQLQVDPYYPPTSTPIPTQQTAATTPTISVPTTTSYPIITEETSQGEETTYSCSAIADDLPQRLRFDLQIQNFGTLTIVAVGGRYYWTSATTAATEMNSIRDSFFEAVRMQYEINVARWIQKEEIQRNQINSVEDVEKIFKTMNDERSFISEAPLEKGNVTIHGDPGKTLAYYGNIKMSEIHNKVAKSIFEAVVANNLQQYTNKEDLFPPLQHYMVHLFTTFDRYNIYSSDYQIRSDDFYGCYISGTSPALFLYTTKNIEASIQPVSFSSYAHPALSNAIWNVYMNDNNMYVNNILMDYLYYEYDASKVTFTQPQEGYSVKKDAWEKVVNSIAQQLELTLKEKQALVTDVRNALPKIQTPYIQIALVNEDEINQKLPLQITPQPETLHRMHLLLTPQSTQQSIAQPLIKPLSRKGFTVIELGVAVGK